MDIEAECFSTHLIEGDGTFNGVGLDNFIEQIKLDKCGLSYAVVSIMGPQSSGKSTLLNHLFNTNFKEMNAYMGRSQTTKGIWIARCPGIEPCTIVMDLEGTDGRERGEDDTAFEKQSALFALSVSDIVLINMWCHDIGRVQAANKPLLKTVFQVMLRLFSPRKTTLMFVIRDKTRTPLEHLEPLLREDIQKIWDSIPKLEAHKRTPLSEFFDVHIVALSSYEEKEEQFKQQVASLRQKLFHSIAPGGLVSDRRGVVPASSFSFSTQQIWKVIKDNKDLDLQAHKVMVANVRCEEIAIEKYSSFVENEDWLKLEKAVQSHLVPGFGEKLNSLVYNCLSSYDEETAYFEDSVRSAKRKQLEDKLKQLVQPAYQLMLEHIRTGTLDNFRKELSHAVRGGQGFAVVACDCTNKFVKLFDELSHAICEDAVIKLDNSDLDKVRNNFVLDLSSHIVEFQTRILSGLTTFYKAKLKEALYGPVEVLLKGGSDDTWPAIRKLLHDETETASSEFYSALSGFEMDKQSNDDMILIMKNYAREVIEGKTREEAERVLYHMKERFTSIFNYDNDSMPRVWTGMEEIRAITKTAHSSCLKLLSVLAAIRLDEDTDAIGDTLVLRLMSPYNGINKSTTSEDPLASPTWKEVPATKTLITPVQCKSLWNQFQKETEDTIAQAVASQEVKKRKISSCYTIPHISTKAGATTSLSSCAIMDANIEAAEAPANKRSKRGRSESIVDWELLEQFKLADEIRGLLGIEYTKGEVDIKSPEWVNFFSIVEPIYLELCQEFHATYRFNEKIRDYTDDKALTFKLGGSEYRCSVKEFGVRMGLYPQALAADNNNFLRFLESGEVAPAWDFNYARFWSTIAESKYVTNQSRESQIRSPIHRILRRMIAYSFTGRSDPCIVTRMDLWYLFNFLNKDKHCNVAHCLASYLAGGKTRTVTRGGHFVTRLAKSYPFFTKTFCRKLTKSRRMTLVDQAALIRMKVLPRGGRPRVLKLLDPLDSEDPEDEGLDENEDEDFPKIKEEGKGKQALTSSSHSSQNSSEDEEVSSSSSSMSEDDGLPNSRIPPPEYLSQLPPIEQQSEEFRQTRGMFKNIGRWLMKIIKKLDKQ